MGDVQIPDWLKGLPLAPVFRPTDTEFADPIAYISKIEKEASAFGICKIIPPLPKPSKKYVIANLNKSLAKCPELGPDINLVGSGSSSKKSCVKEVNGEEFRAVFTTRQQELGLSTKNKKGVQPQPPAARKQVWQSGEVYTLEQFESKSKAFAKSQLGMVKELSPLVIETLFWKAASEKPIYIEYANDVPGSGFGEPEGSFLHFRRRRRRKWTYNRNSGGSCDRNKYQADSTSNNTENAFASTKGSPQSPFVKSKAPSCLPTTLSNQRSQHSRQDGSDVVSEVEGTAGWKLSNSPWNLQVISRSPGSLTRFMPDDIPGVTSPMIYIGMLFSWFAWHVEDHELHSMNFLHTGSPKTWYAVPVDYAFTFEEVIRNQAYGGTIDRLAALTHLGEKTTLLSPEVVVESGIPCCRLVQYPGEFVVTFPRAYHVGFSHGFNCGEAANFGTSKWLQVAKEAAVRRAAMNCLPMLSHQQLLYLLTMSFVSRVPRSLLPGARSSRLRDRLKEERELSVKRSFIEDILRENKLLTTLLGRDSSYHVVLWDLDSLPSLSKGSEQSSSVTPLETATAEAISSKNKNDKDLASEMNLYMENVNDLYSNDDLSCDLQVDSGTLACMACGILGFPFMSVVQPSKQASLALLQDMGESKHTHPDSPVLDDMVGAFVSDELTKKTERKPFHHANGVASRAESSTSMASSSKDLSTAKPPQDLPTSVDAKLDKDSSSTRGFLRPRIFCLEHAIQIEEMLRSRGGASVLVLCHSDFQKIKAHAAAIAEEIGSSFKYTEIPLDRASEEDLNLMDIAIDDDHGDHNVEDWTSKLKVNLRHYVNIRKTCPSKEVQHALALDGLFSSATPISSTLNLNWSSRRSRTKVIYNLLALQMKPSKNVQQQTPDLMELSTSNQIGENEVLNTKSDVTMVRKEGKLLHYSRRNFKLKRCCGAATGLDSGHSEVTPATVLSGSGLNEHGKNCDIGKSEKHLVTENAGSSTVATPRVEDAETQQNDGFLDVAVSEDKASAAENGSEDDDDKVDEHDNEPSVEDTDIEQSGNQTNSEVSIEENSSLVRAGTSCSDDTTECNSESQGEKPQAEEEEVGTDTEEVDSGGEEESLNVNGDEENETATSYAEESTSVSTEESHEDSSHANATEEADSNGEPNKDETCHSESSAKTRRKRRREVDMLTDVQFDLKSFIRSPCEGLRSRPAKQPKTGAESTRVTDDKPTTRRPAREPSTSVTDEKPSTRKLRTPSVGLVSGKKVKKDEKKGCFKCDLQGCRASFHKKEHLRLHKSNRCPHEGCRKKFSCHKYLLRHQKVHNDDRPLKCSWKGCNMTFKWAWARTEHLRVHTGERPYQCKVEGCGLRFRFVSDYSRHRRKTGHYVNPSS